MNLEIDETKAKQFDKLESTSITLLQDYLDGKRSGGDDVVTARCILGVIKGNRQTQTAREALRYTMVQDMADETLRSKYIKATQPEIKRLTGKS